MGEKSESGKKGTSNGKEFSDQSKLQKREKSQSVL